jgi:hypothetical protein
MSTSSDLASDVSRATVTGDDASLAPSSSKIADKERKEKEGGRGRIPSGGKGSMPSSCDVSPRSSHRIHVPTHSKTPPESATSTTEKPKRSSKIMNLRIDLPKVAIVGDEDKNTPSASNMVAIDEDGNPIYATTEQSVSLTVSPGEGRAPSSRGNIFVRKRSGTGAKHLRGADSARGSVRQLVARDGMTLLLQFRAFPFFKFICYVFCSRFSSS